MRRTITLASLLAFTLTALPAQGSLWSRLKGAGKEIAAATGASTGTVMALQRADGETLRTAVLILDTSIGSPLGCFVFAEREQTKIQNQLELGSTLIVARVSAGTVDIGELTCSVVHTWRARREGNPTRRDFLLTYRLPVMLYALRGKPDALEHFFGGISFAPMALELPILLRTLEAVGLTIDLELASRCRGVCAAAVSRVSRFDSPDPALLACRIALRDASLAIEGIGPVASSIAAGKGGTDHHGEILSFAELAAAQAGIEEYFTVHTSP